MKKWEAIFFRWFFTFTTIIAITFFSMKPDFIGLLLIIFSMFAAGVFWMGKCTGVEKTLK